MFVKCFSKLIDKMKLYSAKKTKEIYLQKQNENFKNITTGDVGKLNPEQVANLLNEEINLSEMATNNNHILDLINKFELLISLNG